ncbi:HORMA domain containing protein [Kribbella sp. NPDC050820]|uniref:HORMA domain containing protein n=1 Tax=Kribbella sp. NPDC050820 TaxID=3155408 RepID=UPI00340D4185
MSTRVRVNTHTYAATHVATNMLRSMKQIIRESGLSITRLQNEWSVLEAGVATWLDTQHLKGLVLEVYDPLKARGADLVGRFDFTIDYGYYGDGDGDLWLDPDTISYTVRKSDSYPSRCEYRFVADTSPGHPAVDGWSTTTLRSTAGFSRHSVGTAIGGGSLGAGLSYYTRSS